MIEIDMKMPENCSKCKLENINMMGTAYACRITGKRTTGVREAIREEHCPLREIKAKDNEADPDKFEVGDEVIDNGDYGVVTWIGDDIIVMWNDGSSGYYGPADVKKTGRHYDEISAVLGKLKEGNE